MKNRCLIFLLLALALVMVPYCWSYQERLILSVESGPCSLRVEADDQSRVLRLRVSPETETCPTERQSMLSALRAVSSKTDDPGFETTYSSLYIGRLIDYPWLSQYLAETAYQDPAWSTGKGRPVKLDINKYVARVLLDSQVTVDVEKALGRGYAVISVSVEKVLVGGFRLVPGYQGRLRSGKIPFDAQVWFRLERR